MKGWLPRWFILDPESGLLEYFEVSMTENFNKYMYIYTGYVKPLIAHFDEHIY
jgi:hypothetical protein